MNEINEITRKRNEVIKRIEERQRMMELIKSKHVTKGLTEIELFRKKALVIKIQTAWRRKMKINKLKSMLIEEKANAKYIYNSSVKGNGFDYPVALMKIQRAVRNWLMKINRARIRDSYLSAHRKHFYQPILCDRANELCKEIIQHLKSAIRPQGAAYETIINNYFENYRNFCFDFPNHVQLREDNLLYYYQCLALVEHMEKTKNIDLLTQFTQFRLDVNKQREIKRQVDKILESIQSKMIWYQYCNIDDFEENNLLDDIDSMFHFEKRNKILGMK